MGNNTEVKTGEIEAKDVSPKEEVVAPTSKELTAEEKLAKAEHTKRVLTGRLKASEKDKKSLADALQGLEQKIIDGVTAKLQEQEAVRKRNAFKNKKKDALEKVSAQLPDVAEELKTIFGSEDSDGEEIVLGKSAPKTGETTEVASVHQEADGSDLYLRGLDIECKAKGINLDDVVGDSDFDKFRNKTIPYVGITYGEALDQCGRTHDYRRAAQIVEAFATSKKIEPEKKDITPLADVKKSISPQTAVTKKTYTKQELAFEIGKLVKDYYEKRSITYDEYQRRSSELESLVVASG